MEENRDNREIIAEETGDTGSVKETVTTAPAVSAEEERRMERAAREARRQERKRRLRNNIIWVVVIMYLLLGFVAGFAHMIFEAVLIHLYDWSDAMRFVLLYTAVFAEIVTLVIILYIMPHNRFILRGFLPKNPDRKFRKNVLEDNYIAANNNTPTMLLYGLLLGFLTNFFCILCALLHGDIKLIYDFNASQIPLMIFALISVFIQSTSEELWCRGYLYERLNVHYPLWVAVAVNGVLFGFLHIFNPGVSAMAIIGIAICGISYSLVRWYTGSIWIAMGIHTMWNFTQNFLFGLPNSGIVSEVSVFHLAAATGSSNLIYDYSFGVEAALPALFIDALLGVVVLILAKKNGRLGELLMSHEKRYAMAQQAEMEAAETAE